MKKILFIFTGLTLSLTSLAQVKYTDVAEIPSWAERSVEQTQAEGIITGFGDGTFQPYKNLNRAEALVMIFRVKGIDEKNVKTNTVKSSFPDVPVGSWFENAVIYATEQGWVKGFPNGNFHPEKELNKAELAVILQRVFALESDSEKIPRFSDIVEESWFKESVLALYNNDLIRHDRAYKFFPDNKVSRVEAAWVFAEILKKPRLMGTSATNSFEDGVSRSSRRVAIRKKDLNVEKQGYEIEKAAIYVNVYDKIDQAEMIIGSDWEEIGNVILENKLSDDVTLDNISFKMNFESNVGPARNFTLKMLDENNEVTEVDFPRNGTIFITDWKKSIKAGVEYKFKVYVKSKDITGYYSGRGIGTVYLSDLKATTLAKYVETGYTNYQTSPIVYNSRNFGDVNFNPVIE